jgi:RNA polymerase subunit RPABC4/transcription elongation factor Spt4
MSSQLCPRCGNPVRVDAQSCQFCGHAFGASRRSSEPRAFSVGVSCPKCGKVNSADAKICDYCQSPLDASVPGTTPPRAGLPAAMPPVSYPSPPIGMGKERARIPLRLIALAAGAVVLAGLIVGALVWLSTGGGTQVAKASPTSTPTIVTSVGTTPEPTPSPVMPSQTVTPTVASLPVTK